MTIGLKRHYPARGRVSAGWRPRSGFNNAVPSMAGSLEVVRSGLGWDPLMGRRLGPSADEQRASVCARARARCQWRQLANYTGRLHPMADVASWSQQVTMECGEGKQKEGEEIVFVCVVIGPKPRVTERSIRCPSHSHSKHVCPSHSHSRQDFETNNNPIVVHRTPTVRSVLWFRQDRLGRCL